MMTPEEYFAQAATAILESIKARDGRFRELKELAIWCHCTKQGSRLVRIFVGPDEDGVVRHWVLTPTRKRGAHGTIPPRAQPSVDAGQRTWTMKAECPRCKQGWAVFPAGIPDDMRSMPTLGIGGYLTLVETAAPGGSPAVGDYVEVTQIQAWMKGPGTLALARLEPPKRSNVAS